MNDDSIKSLFNEAAHFSAQKGLEAVEDIHTLKGIVETHSEEAEVRGLKVNTLEKELAKKGLEAAEDIHTLKGIVETHFEEAKVWGLRVDTLEKELAKVQFVANMVNSNREKYRVESEAWGQEK
ncbi:hypothetical protein HAX54_033491 [Datura stramonium]|uniref:Uncharacterized protein n=1 Tax=Datura stramonium TaxID=4076 RepID=A0ABS8VCH0_DATST|nr:hypothetical protein [Datura stramonium]